MNKLRVSEIEQALFRFRTGRRLVLDKLLKGIGGVREIKQPFLLLSRLFVRLKSADSIIEKVNRKGIVVHNVDEISEKIPDILGVRIITENLEELQAIDRLLGNQFEIVARFDRVAEPGDLGERGIEYSLSHRSGEDVYHFEVQLRTFLQHYWASQSFHLFHKKSREEALKYRETLTSLSESLQDAERITTSLPMYHLVVQRGECSGWAELPLCSQVHLIVVEPGEQFAQHMLMPLSGNEVQDHKEIVERKLGLYSSFPNCAIVECSCMDFTTFMLNEPQVQIPANRFDRMQWQLNSLKSRSDSAYVV